MGPKYPCSLATVLYLLFKLQMVILRSSTLTEAYHTTWPRLLYMIWIHPGKLKVCVLILTKAGHSRRICTDVSFSPLDGIFTLLQLVQDNCITAET